ncbi:transposase IS663-like protein, partial [Streptococcus sobrinus DSM 20742 = ATCC 33478]
MKANANKYSFVWRKAVAKFSAKLQATLKTYFQEEINPLIPEAIVLDDQEPVTSEQLTEFSQILEEEWKSVNQAIEENP